MPNPTILSAVGDEDRSVREATWVLTTADPIGTPVQWPEYGDRTWAVAVGTAGAATLEIQGANTNVEADFVVLSNAAGGTALSFTTQPQCESSIEAPRFARPKLTVVGVGAVWTVVLIARRGSGMRT